MSAPPAPVLRGRTPSARRWPVPGATIHDAILGVTEPPPAGEGVLEKSGSPARRARFTRAQIEAFLPGDGAKGPFTFPAPYNTTGVRLTNRDDCANGQDCLWYVG